MSEQKLVLIVNGKPRAGKDTFAQFLNELIPVYKYSMIDKVKTIAMECGWRGQKTEKDRKFLNDLKKLTDDYSSMAFLDVIEKVKAFDNGEITEDVMIIDVREPEDIEELADATGALTVFIKNDNVPAITSNPADANVENFDYDITIDNSGTLEEFKEAVEEFLYILSLLSFYNGEEDDE